MSFYYSNQNLKIFFNFQKKNILLLISFYIQIIFKKIFLYNIHRLYNLSLIFYRLQNQNIKKKLKVFFYRYSLNIFIFNFERSLYSNNQDFNITTQIINFIISINEKNKLELIRKLKYQSYKKVEVSIIIPAYNNLNLTLNCLISVLLFTTKIKYEIILIDDNSSKINYKTLGLKFKIIRNKKNIGFIKSNNLASKEARGKFLFFLNNDTIVNTTTITELRNSYFLNERVGAVGSKSLALSNLIQEAGAFTFKSGTCWNYGRSKSSDQNIYNFTREVDYVSACSLFIKKKLFHKLGFFDERYCPAYYEDVDLAFKIRQKKLLVLYEPKSTLYHIEGATSGLDIESGIKRYQKINKSKFVKKWSKELQKYPLNLNQKLKIEDEKRILIVDDLVPDFIRDAGSFYMHNFIQILLYFKFKITILASEQNLNDNFYFSNKAMLERQGIEIIPKNVMYNEDFLSLRINHFSKIILTRPNNFDLCYKHIKNKKKIIYCMVDFHQQRLIRSLNINKKKNQDNNYFLISKLENKALKLARKTLVYGTQDKKELLKQKKINRKKILLFPLVNLIVKKKNIFKFSKINNLIFIGNFNHNPNLVSLNNFINNFFLKLCKINENINLNVIGNLENYKKIIHNKIIYNGRVDDLSPFFEKTIFSVIPIEYGAGISGKLLYSMSRGIPCLVSKFIKDQMNLTDRINCIEIDYTKDINFYNKLINNKALVSKLSNNSLKYIKNNYSLKANMNNINEINKILFEGKSFKKDFKNIKIKNLI